MSGPARRMLTDEEAADYCGFSSVNGFRAHILVAPVNFGKLVRYDRVALDAYLDSLRSSPDGNRVLELAGAGQSGRR